MHALFFKMLCRPILNSRVYQAWMQASPRWGCVSQGYPLELINGCSSLLRRRQLQSRSTWVSLTLYLMVSFTTRCCFCQNTLLAFLGHNTPTPLILDILSKSMPQFWRRFAEKVKLTRMVNGRCLSLFC